MANSTTGSSNPPPPAVASGNRLVWILVLVFGSLFGSTILLLVAVASGQMIGQEFSPDLFKRRNFHYTQIPIIQFQVYPITRTDYTGELAIYLKQHKYITSTNANQPRWDLIYQGGIDPSSENCDARLLCEYLDQYDENRNLLWLEWTEDHPALGKVFWPIIAKLARKGDYLLVPELFGLAKDATKVELFQRSLNTSLSQQYRLRAEMEQKQSNHSKAVDYFTEALSYDPLDPDALRSRATSYDALGEREKSRADLAEASRHNRVSAGSE